MSRKHTALVIAGIMTGLFLASMEATIVGTAMPTIVAQLGGLSTYAWVFSLYMLTSTSTIPIFGKLSDMYGRRPIYLIAVALFLIGSMLSATANSMTELILFRGLQGLGAGGLLPLTFTIIGDIFTMEQRAKWQGLFSGVWGVSGFVGPLIGGFLVDNISWRWIFYVNIPFGLAAAALIWFFLKEPHPQHTRHSLDLRGVALLVSGVMSFLLVLLQGPTQGWTSPEVLGLAATSLVLLAGFVWNEQRVAEPIISPALFQQKLFSVGSAHGFLSGMAMFGSISFIPLFAQGVMGADATGAGAALIPANLGWVFSSIVGSRLLLSVGYRRVAIVSMLIMSIGAFAMSRLNVSTSPMELRIFSFLLGTGMGGGVAAFLISIQSTFPRHQLGSATSTLQFARNIGGTIGVSVYGTVMVARLMEGLARQGANLSIDPRAVLDRTSRIAPELLGPMRGALADAIATVFLLAFTATFLGFLIVLLTPRPAAALVRERQQPEPEAVVQVGGD